MPSSLLSLESSVEVSLVLFLPNLTLKAEASLHSLEGEMDTLGTAKGLPLRLWPMPLIPNFTEISNTDDTPKTRDRSTESFRSGREVL